jgi:hypothetical protein
MKLRNGEILSKLTQRPSIYFLRRFLFFLTVRWTPVERGEKKDVNGQKEAVRREILAGGGEIGPSFLHTPQPAL